VADLVESSPSIADQDLRVFTLNVQVKVAPPEGPRPPRAARCRGWQVRRDMTLDTSAACRSRQLAILPRLLMLGLIFIAI
jgi:hypothetical protein